MLDKALHHQLGNFVHTINTGPDALDPALFTGPQDRILLGLKAHANTISYARLTALEDSFPMTRAVMGDGPFNAAARIYAETPPARASDNNSIGAAFPAFMAEQGLEDSARQLAEMEWAWLTSYNAADAPSLHLGQLGGMDEAAMLALHLIRHPAAHIVPLHAPLSGPITEQLSGFDGRDDAAALLLTRPENDVLLRPLDTLTAQIFTMIQKSTPMGNLLSVILEQGGEDAPLEPILTLIGAGALMAAPAPGT
ncbi:MAG: DUF2063 domain-containing protein [Sphingomonadales bacterium]|nr:DUF2063 domain-containing protein [Sphingomonadales bacterium]